MQNFRRNTLDKNEKFCYTYDVLNRVTAKLTSSSAITGAVGEFVDGVKAVAATATNAIYNGAKAAWDWLSFWD